MILCIAALDREDAVGTCDAFRAAASTAIVKLFIDAGIEVVVSAAAKTFSISVELY
jgi:hypothetical protein